MKMRIWLASAIVVGVTMFMVGLLFHILSPLIVPGLEQQYRNRELFRDWNGWTSTYMLMHPFLFAPVFSAGFLLLPGTSRLLGVVPCGLSYGAGVFCVGSLPVFLLVFASLQMPFAVFATWILQNLVQYLAAGIALCFFANGMTLRRNTQLSVSTDNF